MAGGDVRTELAPLCKIKPREVSGCYTAAIYTAISHYSPFRSLATRQIEALESVRTLGIEPGALRDPISERA